MSGKKMGSGKVTFDFLFEKRIHPNKRIFLEILRNVFQWNTFLLPGDSCVPFELKFSCLRQGTSSINQGAEQSSLIIFSSCFSMLLFLLPFWGNYLVLVSVCFFLF